jgi:hypothetical protein
VEDRNVERPERKTVWRARLTALALASLLAASPLAAREKIDIVVLDNGDELTCEIRELTRGILKVKTSYFVNTVSIEWNHVERVVSTQFFEVEMEDGTRHYGGIAAVPDEDTMVVMTGLGATPVDHDALVRIAQIEERITDRIKASVDLGFNAFKANEEKNLNIRASFSYRTKKKRFSADLNSDVSTRNDAEATRHNKLNFNYSRFLGRRWFWFTRPGFERNDETDLEQRLSLDTGAGRWVLQTNHSLLSAHGGLSVNRERYLEEVVPEPQESGSSSTSDTNLEALLGLQYELFTFGNRDTDLTIKLDTYPNLTTSGRVRLVFGSTLRHEVVNDLYVSLNLDATYDNKPPTEAEGSDWSLVSGVGYSF